MAATYAAISCHPRPCIPSTRHPENPAIMLSQLLASEIQQLIEQRFPRLKFVENGGCDSYYLDYVRKSRGSTRILRVKRPASGACEIKLVVSTPAGSRLARAGQVVSDLEELATIITAEITLFESKGAGVASPPTVPSVHRASGRGAAWVVDGETAFQFDRDERDVDPSRRLLYYWDIRNVSGEIMGRYVGKATSSGRPFSRYARRVENLLRGDTYGRSGPPCTRGDSLVRTSSPGHALVQRPARGGHRRLGTACHCGTGLLWRSKGSAQ